jgi:hypothetical protein
MNLSMDTNSTDRVSTDFPLVYLGLFYPRNPADLGALPSPSHSPSPIPKAERATLWRAVPEADPQASYWGDYLLSKLHNPINLGLETSSALPPYHTGGHHWV